jgi:uracil phosphoribosyltransferase
MVAVHLIVTPEYLRRITQEFPELHIFAVRLDRGLSAPSVLETIPGTHWDQERGLNDIQYIVPGAGGVGELLNNAWV